MDICTFDEISNIFVGRELFLQRLQYLLNDLVEHKQADYVRILLNTPGIGKTKAIEYFGKSLMKKIPVLPNNHKENPNIEFALYIQVNISHNDSLNDIYHQIIDNTLYQFQNFYSINPQLIPKKWAKNFGSSKIENFNQLQLEVLIPLINIEELKKNPAHLLRSISREIPIIFHLDEFQETIHGDNKGIYYDIGNLLASLLKFPILSILTGTKFTIMKTIGNNRITPLNGKVDELILPYLSIKEQKLFVEEVIKNAMTPKELLIKNIFSNWIIFNSGGHPRTMEYMAKTFVKNFPTSFNSELKFQKHDKKEDKEIEEFFNKLDHHVKIQLEGVFWKSKYRYLFEEKANNLPKKMQEDIILFITSLIEKNLRVPNLIVNIKNAQSLKEHNQVLIEEFLAFLVQIGYLLINGHGNFFIPSSYALQAFLTDWNNYLHPWDQIFEEFLNNSLVRDIMYHSPQSLGWSFEVFVKYGILALTKDLENNEKFPHCFSEIYGNRDILQNFKCKIPNNYEKRDIEVSKKLLEEIPEGRYIVLPQAKAFDGLIKCDSSIIVIQITSGKDKTYLKNKIRSFQTEITNLQKSLIGEKKNFLLIPWFVSLKKIDPDIIPDSFSGFITDELFWDHIISRKKNF